MAASHRHNGGRSSSTPPESSHSLNRSPLWERDDGNGGNSRRERNRRRRPAEYDFAEDEEGSLIQFDRVCKNPAADKTKSEASHVC